MPVNGPPGLSEAARLFRYGCRRLKGFLYPAFPPDSVVLGPDFLLGPDLSRLGSVVSHTGGIGGVTLTGVTGICHRQAIHVASALMSLLLPLMATGE